MGDAIGIEESDRCVSGRHEPPPVIEHNTNTARRSRRETALEQRAAEAADFILQLAVAHCRTAIRRLQVATSDIRMNRTASGLAGPTDRWPQQFKVRR